MRVETRGPDGKPMCYVCGTPVEQAGTACSLSCVTHFVHVIQGQTVVHVEDGLVLDIWGSPRHTKHDEAA